MCFYNIFIILLLFVKKIAYLCENNIISCLYETSCCIVYDDVGMLDSLS